MQSLADGPTAHGKPSQGSWAKVLPVMPAKGQEKKHDMAGGRRKPQREEMGMETWRERPGVHIQSLQGELERETNSSRLFWIH